MISCEPFFEYSSDEETGVYGTYGIAVHENGRLIQLINDITTEEEKVSELVYLFNTERPEPEHIAQMIEDFLYDLEV